MASPTNHWKLGLFLVVGLIGALATVVFLSARSLQKKTVAYVTYFDESVQGLEVGSPVKFRGVTVGTVSLIDVGPDHRHVGVRCELGVAQLDDLGLNAPRGLTAHFMVPPDLRMQLASAGITGVKFILVDFFPVADNPRPVLPFPTPENYIPSASSTMKNLEDAVVRAVNRIPEIADEMLSLVKRVSKILESIDDRNLTETLVRTMNRVDELVTSINGKVRDVDTKTLSHEAIAAIGTLNATIAQMGKVLDRVQSEQGVLAGAERTTSALNDVARNANGLGLELEETLRDVQAAAEAVQRLGDALDRDGDMLVKGRSKAVK